MTGLFLVALYFVGSFFLLAAIARVSRFLNSFGTPKEKAENAPQPRNTKGQYTKRPLFRLPHYVKVGGMHPGGFWL